MNFATEPCKIAQLKEIKTVKSTRYQGMSFFSYVILQNPMYSSNKLNQAMYVLHLHNYCISDCVGVNVLFYILCVSLLQRT